MCKIAPTVPKTPLYLILSLYRSKYVKKKNLITKKTFIYILTFKHINKIFHLNPLNSLGGIISYADKTIMITKNTLHNTK